MSSGGRRILYYFLLLLFHFLSCFFSFLFLPTNELKLNGLFSFFSFLFFSLLTKLDYYIQRITISIFSPKSLIFKTLLLLVLLVSKYRLCIERMCVIIYNNGLYYIIICINKWVKNINKWFWLRSASVVHRRLPSS